MKPFSCTLKFSGCLEEKFLCDSLSCELNSFCFHEAPFSLERIIDTLWTFSVGIFSRSFYKNKQREIIVSWKSLIVFMANNKLELSRENWYIGKLIFTTVSAIASKYLEILLMTS